jgi:hypothetical protein
MTWDPAKMGNHLIGEWKWEYISCFWTPEDVNLYELEVDPPVMQLYGRKLFCDTWVNAIRFQAIYYFIFLHETIGQKHASILCS